LCALIFRKLLRIFLSFLLGVQCLAGTCNKNVEFFLGS
jgi:hypothetical protein